MPVVIPVEVYERLEQKFGKKEAKEIVDVLESALQEIERKAEEKLDGINNKAEHLITQKKFELKDELTKELATKEDVARLEGNIQTMKVTLDRKFTIMFLILLFTTIFVNQNALVFIAQVFGLVK